MRFQPGECETVQTAIQKASDTIASLVSGELQQWKDLEQVESPIEAVFAIWWQVLRFGLRMVERDAGLFLQPQYEVALENARYRLDFAVDIEDPPYDAVDAGIPLPLIGVELDGHEFHERTKEQVEQRNRRDRDLQAAGWKIFHYSGSEVVKSGDECVIEVMKYARRQYRELHRKAQIPKQSDKAMI